MILKACRYTGSTSLAARATTSGLFWYAPHPKAPRITTSAPFNAATSRILVSLFLWISKSSVEAELLDIQGTYNALQSDAEKANHYGYLRRLFNVKIQNQHHDAQMAALLIFLNKAGFNGLYRVNKSGEYNVPSAHKKTICSFTHDNLLSVSSALQNATILCGDFEAAMQTASLGDFVFFDSPYYNTFDTYQSNGFSEADHRRLANLFQALTDKGVNCMLTNSNDDFILSLYKDFYIRTVQVKRLVNCDASKRIGEEIIVTNYEFR